MARPTQLNYQKYTKELFEDLYIRQNLSRGGICERLGLPESQVRTILAHWGIKKSLELRTACQRKGVEAKARTGFYKNSTLANWKDPKIRRKRIEGMARAVTPEVRKKMSERRRGRVCPESQKQKMRELWAAGKWDFFRSEEYWNDKRKEWSQRSKDFYRNLSPDEQARRKNLFVKNAHTPHARKKRLETMRAKDRFGNKSRWEDWFYNQIITIFPQTKRQYKSKEYPWHCDFYIPEKALYLELNLFWTHGKKPYEGTKADKQIVEFWESKKNTFYNTAIKTWTDLDVRKRSVAKKNNLNFKELFTIEECKLYLSELKLHLL